MRYLHGVNLAPGALYGTDACGGSFKNSQTGTLLQNSGQLRTKGSLLGLLHHTKHHVTKHLCFALTNTTHMHFHAHMHCLSAGTGDEVIDRRLTCRYSSFMRVLLQCMPALRLSSCEHSAPLGISTLHSRSS